MRPTPIAAMVILFWGLDLPLIAKDWDFEGYLRTGVEVDGFRNGETVNRAELSVESKRKEGVKAEFTIRADSNDRLTRLKEAFIDSKGENGRHWDFGLNKKIVGMEYQLSRKKRPNLRRSILYRKLETFAYVGREMRFGIRQKAEFDESQSGWQAHLTYGESLDLGLPVAWHQPCGSFNCHLFALLQSDKIDQSRQTVGVLTVALHQPKSWMVELISGIDPFESEFAKTFGDGKSVWFFGGKAQFEYHLSKAWQLYGILSHVIHDSETPKFRSQELILGNQTDLNEDLTLGLELGLVASTSRLEPDTYTYDDSRSSIVLEFDF